MLISARSDRRFPRRNAIGVQMGGAMNDMDTMEKRQDSRQRLFEALMTLMKAKSFTEITVTELVQTANLSRMTFYRNYSNVSDILHEHLSNDLFGGNITSDIIRRCGDKRQLTLYFVYLKNNKELIDNVINSGLSLVLMDEIRQMVDKFWRLIDKNYAMDAVAVSAIKGIFFSVSIDWIKSGMKQSPESMGNILYSFLKLIAQSYGQITGV